jgi:hypothetical protein
MEIGYGKEAGSNEKRKENTDTLLHMQYQNYAIRDLRN